MNAEPAALTRLARLRREMDVDRSALEARAAEAQELLGAWSRSGSLPRPELIVLAVNLHGYYTALEAIFERVAKLLDEEMPTGPYWHLELIEQMRTAVPGLRPEILPGSVVEDLQELRKFRHFFRNAYVLDLDPAAVRGHAERLGRIHPDVVSHLATFRAHLDGMLDALTR